MFTSLLTKFSDSGVGKGCPFSSSDARTLMRSNTRLPNVSSKSLTKTYTHGYNCGELVVSPSNFTDLIAIRSAATFWFWFHAATNSLSMMWIFSTYSLCVISTVLSSFPFLELPLPALLGLRSSCSKRSRVFLRTWMPSVATESSSRSYCAFDVHEISPGKWHAAARKQTM